MNIRRPRALDAARRFLCAAALTCAATGASGQTVSALDVTTALEGNSAISSPSAAMVDAREAARRLGQARLEREQGVQALPRERARGKGIHAVNHRYWQRQEKMRRMVEQALHRSNETRPAQRVRGAPRDKHPRQRNKTIVQESIVSR
jgi:hypothetical protein